MPKRKRKDLNFIDRFPFVAIIVIGIAAFLIFTFVVNRLPLSFFSGAPASDQSEEDLRIYIASPVHDRLYELVTANETISIDIKAKEIEAIDAVLKIFINGDEIREFSSPPYEMNWRPRDAGMFEIYANAFSPDGEMLSESNKIIFEVKYMFEHAGQDESRGLPGIDIEEKKNIILENAFYRAQNGPPLFSYKTYKEMSIDGDLDDWGDFEKFTAFKPTIKKENYTTPQDLSGAFSSAWDEENFYFVIKVVDDIINQPYTSNQINKGDCIALAFDTDIEGDMNVPFLNEDDYLFEISPGDFSGKGPESFVRWPSNAPLIDALIASKKTDDGYILEAAIPWSNFGDFAPQDETVMGFTVSIMDTDNLTDEEDNFITELVISSSNQFDFNNTFTFGTLILIDIGEFEPVLEEEQ
jgi:hypothetical protein